MSDRDRNIDEEMLRLAELAKQVLRERGWTDEKIEARMRNPPKKKRDAY